ncbi:MAG: hypothetical protein KBG15_00760 [Kofleriaceae bacterium]|nr:hypothetical protein [Kofleriaceae bacterium]
MSTVIARDASAADQLVYTWPYPIGAECDVQCNSDDQVVMCPAWTVGNSLGPGRHRWRTPDPMRPTAAYFVLTGPVEVGFDCATSFVVPLTQQPVRIRASGSVTVRCSDPMILVAQFVGLPFYDIDRGLKQSVARSVERILARLLIRRTVTTGSTLALMDRAARGAIIEELLAFHPAGGAVFGLEFARLLSLDISVDDGSQILGAPAVARPIATRTPSPGQVTVRDSVVDMTLAKNAGHAEGSVSGDAIRDNRDNPKVTGSETVRGRAPGVQTVAEILQQAQSNRASQSNHGMPAAGQDATAAVQRLAAADDTLDGVKPVRVDARQSVMGGTASASGSFGAASSAAASSAGAARRKTPQMGVAVASDGAVAREASSANSGVASGEITPRMAMPSAGAPMVAAMTAPQSAASGEFTPRTTTAPPAMPAVAGEIAPRSNGPQPRGENDPQGRGAIMAVGGMAIGMGNAASGEVPTKVPAGGRVLVQGGNGLMQAAVVKQLLSGYYELEVGSTGETMWVPMAKVVPQ